MSIVPPSPHFPDALAVRRCRKCGEDKPLTAFVPRYDGTGRYRRICRACHSTSTQGYVPDKQRQADEPWPCSVCGVLKPLEQFVTHSAKPLGKGYRCIECERKRGAAAREKRRSQGYKRPALTESQKEHERWMQRKRAYGLSKADVMAMLEQQEHKCALCLRPLRLDGKRGYFVDHCHTTGRIRGILCPLCNGFLARIGDDEAGARRVLSYVIGSPPGNPPVKP